MKSLTLKKRPLIAVGLLLIFAIGIFGLLPQIGGFSESFKVLKNANVGIALVAVMASLSASLISARIYKALAYKSLRFMDVATIQLSGLLINRIVPAGLGGLGLNFAFLRTHRHSNPQATTVVALNNLLGFVGHGLLAIGLLALYPLLSGETLAFAIPESWHNMQWIAVVLLAVALLAVILAGESLRHRVRHQVKLLSKYYAKHPSRLLLAVILSCFMTLCNVLSFWLCCIALQIDVSLVSAFIAFTFGIGAATATPTPGGIGGAEAGLVAGLLSQGVPVTTALAAALLYRLVSFWFGLVIGAGATVIMVKRHLVKL